MNLIRNLSTETVHRPECRVAGNEYTCRTWRWAEGRTLEEVTAATREFPWLHLCRTCLRAACQCGKCLGGPVVIQ